MHRSSTPAQMKHAALGQLGLVVIVLLGCLLMPRPGGAVLLVPLFTNSAGVVGKARFAVLRAGWLPGSVLVRVEGDVPVIDLLRSGVLPLGAPALLCRPLIALS